MLRITNLVLLMVALPLLTQGRATFFSDSQLANGNLIIVGGALSKDNLPVLDSIITMAGGARAKIGVISIASNNPQKAFTEFSNAIMAVNGAIKVISIDISSDMATATPSNETEKSATKEIEGCSAIWFTGGDQTKIAAAMLHKDGSPTRALEAIYRLLKMGGLVAGTSAGAAIMSNPMITGGSSLQGLTNGFSEDYIGIEQQDEGQLNLAPGLGFFPYGMVDQHFDKKGRLGRLVVVLDSLKAKFNLGVGIDENTAVIVNLQKATLTCVGLGSITAVNIKTMTKPNPNSFQNIRMTVLENGDVLYLMSQKVIPAKFKKPTKGNEYHSFSQPKVISPLDAYASLKNLLAYYLIDNNATSSVRTYMLNNNGEGFQFNFSKDSLTNGYWGTNGDEVDQYTIVNARLDISPISIIIPNSKL